MYTRIRLKTLEERIVKRGFVLYGTWFEVFDHRQVLASRWLHRYVRRSLTMKIGLKYGMSEG